MRLLLAELRKLNRPLLWSVAASNAAFCLLLAWTGAYNASLDAKTPGGTAAGASAAALEIHPVAVGAVTAGLAASLPGALVIALLAGGHFGGEWGGHTIKTLLSQRATRLPVLGAKLVSLWIAGVAVLLAGWAALAAASPLLSSAYSLPHAARTLDQSARLAGSQFARSLLVIGVFAVIGILAAALTRNTVGTIAASVGVVVGMLVVSSSPGVAQWTPATWVQGWMGFQPGDRTRTPIPTQFWSRFQYAGGSVPSHQLGLWGLVAMMAVGLVVAARLFSRADVTA